MPKGQFLNEKEKTSIHIYKKLGHSNRKIARMLNRSETVVRNFIRLGDQYGKKKAYKREYQTY